MILFCSFNELSLEKSVETAMLLSLSGAGCVLANQWHCTLQQNANKFQTLMKGMIIMWHVTVKCREGLDHGGASDRGAGGW